MAAVWFQIISHLETALRDKIQDSDIQQGFSRNEKIPTPPAIRIYRAEEPDIELQLRPKGSVVLTLEIWEGSSEQNAKAANLQIANREEEVQTFLKAWIKQAEADLKIKIPRFHLSALGDGEQHRPQVAVFYKLSFDWSK